MTTERTAATATRSRTIPLGPCLTILFVGATVLAILPVLIVFAFVQRWLIEGLLAGAVKG